MLKHASEFGLPLEERQAWFRKVSRKRAALIGSGGAPESVR